VEQALIKRVIHKRKNALIMVFDPVLCPYREMFVVTHYLGIQNLDLDA
jgi:hypothetical protein